MQDANLGRLDEMEDEPYDLHDEALTAFDNYMDDGPDYPY